MMTPPLYAWLSADASVAALVGTRIYAAGRAPQGVAGDYITWQLVYGEPEVYVDERPDVDAHRVQIDCWSADEKRVIDLAIAVQTALELHGNKLSDNDDSQDQETQLYRWSFDWQFWTAR